MRHQRKKRKDSPFTFEELTSCMNNQPPGSPELAILSFRGAFHGRLFGSLSTTRSKPLHKLDVPAMNWPAVDFPKLKYPLAENKSHNDAEEKRCLELAENCIKTNRIPVVAVIVEPIQAEGGDNHASPAFFRGLREITKKHDVAFIVDEVQTGGGPTGTFWAHEQWNLPTPPDVVTFSKKLQAAGFYHNMDMRPSESYRNFNTWMGDPLRALEMGVICQEIRQNNLLQLVRDSGAALMKGLDAISQKHPQISRVRGQGTFIAFDLPDAAIRDKLVTNLKHVGAQSGGCGDKSIRLRPMLIFAPFHAELYLDILENAVRQL